MAKYKSKARVSQGNKLCKFKYGTHLGLQLNKKTRNKLFYMIQKIEKAYGLVTGFPSFSIKTYGTLTTMGTTFLFNHIGSTSKDTLLDIGSGVGLICHQAFKCSAIGIELDSRRHEAALALKEAAIPPNVKLQFLNMDIGDDDKLKDKEYAFVFEATVIYISNKMFSPALNLKMTELLIHFKKCHTIISLEALPLTKLRNGRGASNSMTKEVIEMPSGSFSWTPKKVQIFIYKVSK